MLLSLLRAIGADQQHRQSEPDLMIVHVGGERAACVGFRRPQFVTHHLPFQEADAKRSEPGVPCNQFGAQEPGTATEIQAFCKKNYGVTFDLLAKVDVNGEKACGLYKHLTQVQTKPKGPGKIGWNFEKFVLDRKGKIIGRFDPQTKPDDATVLKLITAALAEK